jgi:uncharacterized UBP type Zn finger protein
LFAFSVLTVLRQRLSNRAKQSTAAALTLPLSLHGWQALLVFQSRFLIDAAKLTAATSSSSSSRALSVCPDESLQQLFHAFDQYIHKYNPTTTVRHQSRTAKTATVRRGDNDEDCEGRKGSQQDAMEFLTFVLDVLHEEAIAAERSLSTDERLSLRTATSVAINSSNKDSSSNRDNGDEDEEGWTTVSKAKTVIDERSRVEASAAMVATVISEVFHGLLRWVAVTISL